MRKVKLKVGVGQLILDTAQLSAMRFQPYKVDMAFALGTAHRAVNAFMIKMSIRVFVRHRKIAFTTLYMKITTCRGVLLQFAQEKCRMVSALNPSTIAHRYM